MAAPVGSQRDAAVAAGGAAPPPRLAADAALLALATFWGATFPVGKFILASLPPFAYLASRFALASVLLLPLAWRDVRRLRGRDLAWSLAVGGALAGGFALQTLGLRLAGATLSAFLTAVSVPLVPIFAFLSGKRPSPMEWWGVACASVGLALLTFQGEVRPGWGEVLLLGCAVCFAWHVLFMDRVAARVAPSALGLLQTTPVALLSVLLLPTEPLRARWTPGIAGAVAGMAVLGSAAAFSIMAWAQRHTRPTHVALCLAFEPVAAALFSWWWLSESLAARQYGGAALILVGILLAVAKPSEVR